MSFVRLVYWSALLGGWSAYLGWLLAELFLGRWANVSYLGAILMSAVIALFIGDGLSLVGTLANPSLGQILRRLGPGLACGMVGGLVGAGLGNLLFALLGQSNAVLGTVG